MMALNDVDALVKASVKAAVEAERKVQLKNYTDVIAKFMAGAVKEERQRCIDLLRKEVKNCSYMWSDSYQAGFEDALDVIQISGAKHG